MKNEKIDNLGQIQNVLDRSPGKPVTYYKSSVQSAGEPPPTCTFYILYIYVCVCIYIYVYTLIELQGIWDLSSLTRD